MQKEPSLPPNTVAPHLLRLRLRQLRLQTLLARLPVAYPRRGPLHLGQQRRHRGLKLRLQPVHLGAELRPGQGGSERGERRGGVGGAESRHGGGAAAGDVPEQRHA